MCVLRRLPSDEIKYSNYSNSMSKREAQIAFRVGGGGEGETGINSEGGC